ncbi:inactive hydroxysteroid dehydrogenase-like protein 1 [Penaeus japonicus]|uniref:inactive hydroxysteroid dehydrogenase-like protein 1 n=1 Tax=Penaeus japonicus TaxID=27405 RepID=UPI001C7108C2|nr:inactive hydroxysteroid dehydrogenase-like protein 1 [Penaeus japonicus]
MLVLEESLLLLFPRGVLSVLALVGLLAVGKILARSLWVAVGALRTYVWARLWRKNLVQTYGKWAVVTGSTDGIGESYAKELAKKGMNILLVSRNMEKLQRVAREIRSQYGVETDIVQADFALGRAVYGNIAKGLKGKDIGILVNNVGMLVTPRLFEKLTEDDIWGYVNVNVASVLAMTRLVLPEMLRRKRGAIVNISSLAAHLPLAYFQVYAATKAFVSSFSRALQQEYQPSGLTIQCVEPGAVSTNMTSFDKDIHTPGLFTATPGSFAVSALATLGHSNRTSGYWAHGMQLAMWMSLPESFVLKSNKAMFESKDKKSK